MNLPETISEMVAQGYSVSYIISLLQWLFPNSKWDAVISKLICKCKLDNIHAITVKKWLNTPQ